MEEQRVNTIAVIGAGIMGHGIAQEFAGAGLAVRLTDARPEALHHAAAQMRENLAAMTAMGHPAAEPADDLLQRVTFTTSLPEAVRDVDVVVEAVTEDLPLKQRIFAELDEHAPAHALLVSNTSSFMPSQLAGSTTRPARVIVAHYFNPPYLVPLVELVRGPQTADSTVATLHALYERIGKRPVVVEKEILGFIGNRLQNALFREALALVEQGYASVEDIDAVMQTSIGRRWAVGGIFEVFDLAGLDTVEAVATQIFPGLSNATEPSALLRDHIARGDFGAKTGKGFYDWPPERVQERKHRIREALVWPDTGASGPD